MSKSHFCGIRTTRSSFCNILLSWQTIALPKTALQPLLLQLCFMYLLLMLLKSCKGGLCCWIWSHVSDGALSVVYEAVPGLSCLLALFTLSCWLENNRIISFSATPPLFPSWVCKEMEKEICEDELHLGSAGPEEAVMLNVQPWWGCAVRTVWEVSLSLQNAFRASF